MTALYQIAYHPYYGGKLCKKPGCGREAEVCSTVRGKTLLSCRHCWEEMRHLDPKFPTFEEIRDNGTAVRAAD